jgi:hypothetical protein
MKRKRKQPTIKGKKPTGTVRLQIARTGGEMKSKRIYDRKSKWGKQLCQQES